MKLIFFIFFPNLHTCILCHLQFAALLSKGIHKNISLKTVATRGTSALAMKRRVEYELSDEPKRPLAVLLTWLAAQEKHIEKYRSLWLNKGFDVLTVKMSPQQLLLPKVGSIPLMQDVVKFMYAVSSNYPDMVLHCFSVGAYQFGEIMAHINDHEFMGQIAKATESSSDPKVTLENLIKGIIFDSAVSFEGIPEGVSKAFSLNPALYKPLEWYIRGHLKVAYPIATKWYIRASDYAHGNYLNAPGLFFTSEKDTIGAPWMSAKIGTMWRSRGIDVKEKVFPDSSHVQHMHKYETEYRKEVDDFLKKVPFRTMQ